jgi:hypothetical protein
MHEHDPSRPGHIKTKPNRRGEQCSYYCVDGGTIGLKPSPNGKGKHTVERADEKTCHAAYAALCGVLGLSAEHHAALIARGLTEDEITAGKYSSLPVEHRGQIALEVLKRVKLDGIKPDDLLRVPGFIRRADVPMALAGRAGLLIPVMNAAGTTVGMTLRPDKPALDPKGKALGKYVAFTSSTHGGPNAASAAHVPPIASQGSHEVVRVTEGPLKASIATSKTGLLTIGLPGVGSWRLALPVLKSLGAERVRLAFDSDASVNPNVAGALAYAARGLVASGYKVEVERWNATHKGIDDALVAGVSLEVLTGFDGVRHCLDLAERLERFPYVEPDHVLAWVRFYLDQNQPKALFADNELLDGIVRLEDRDPVEFSQVKTLLRKANLWTVFTQSPRYKAPATSRKDGVHFGNFTARIAREINRHEGSEITRQVVVEARHEDGTVATATVATKDFDSLSWVSEQLGLKFAIRAGRNMKEEFQYWIKVNSYPAVEVQEIYTALGWHTIGGKDVYLDAGGGIGESGKQKIDVDVKPQLAKYRLPAPDLSKLKEGVERVLALLDNLGPDAERAASIIISLPYRALLGPARTVPHFFGTTGTYKTSAACLALRFFAPSLDYDDPMPLTWEATPASAESIRHAAKDSLLPIDNFIADGEHSQAQREWKKIDTVFNSQGDLAGKGRANPDASPIPRKDPRGSLISTGEQEPKRKSALGRSIIEEVKPGSIDFPGLQRCHVDAGEGWYAVTIACYAQYLAFPARLETRRAELRRLAEGYRDAATAKHPGCHKRHAEAIAEWAAALELFLNFAVESSAIAKETARSCLNRVRDGLFKLLPIQAEIQEEADAGDTFLEMLRSSLVTNKVFLVGMDGNDPPENIAKACGWKQALRLDRGEHNYGAREVPYWETAPGASKIGWVDDDYVYLDPVASHAAAARRAIELGRSFGTERQVKARLAETGRIVFDKEEKRRLTKRVSVEGQRLRLLCVHRKELISLAD